METSIFLPTLLSNVRRRARFLAHPREQTGGLPPSLRGSVCTAWSAIALGSSANSENFYFALKRSASKAWFFAWATRQSGQRVSPDSAGYTA